MYARSNVKYNNIRYNRRHEQHITKKISGRIMGTRYWDTINTCISSHKYYDERYKLRHAT